MDFNLTEKLYKIKENGKYPMHMPGHKRSSKMQKYANELSLPYEFDITEIDGYDNLHAPEGILKEREFRDREHLDNMKESVLRLKKDGIIPVIASCPGFDEFIGEKDGIETLTDNDEKAKHLNSNFYKRQTMRNLNEKIGFYSQELEKFAKENDIMFIDLFSVFKKANYENSGLRKEDGCHLTEDKGHPLLAKTILEFLGYENVPDTFEHDELNDEIFEYEQFERSIQYFKHALMSPWLGLDTEEKRAKRFEELKQRQEHWIKRSVNDYVNHNHEIVKIEQTLSQKVYDYINNK